MNWAEVIAVRSTGGRTKELTMALRELKNLRNNVIGPHRLRIYRRKGLDTDFCIVLFHRSGSVQSGGSQLGQRLTFALREFGMVDQTLWIEFDPH